MGLFDKYLQRYGCQERSQGRSQRGCRKGPQKEGRRRWWQGQKEEVVKGKDKGQAQQFGPFRQSNLRETFEGSSNIQAHHTLNCQRKNESSWIPGQKGLDELLKMGLIRLVVSHSAQMIYTRVAREEESEEREMDEVVKEVKVVKEKKVKVNKKDAKFEADAEALAAAE